MTNAQEVFLSIVIANYNYGRFLPDALKSIVSQCGMPVLDDDGRPVLPIVGCDNCFVEIIICDAGSTDNSRTIINDYSDKLSWWCSEKDRGQSEAFNKGFSHARGKWLTWLNADEVYIPGTLQALVKLDKKNPEAKWVTSNRISFDDKTKKITHLTWGPHTQAVFMRWNRAPFSVFGPTSFFRRETYLKVGPIDETLHYAMDYDYWARLTMAGYRQVRLNRFSWAFRVHEESKTAGEIDSATKCRQEQELKYLRDKSRYYYQFSFRNVWYVIWLVMRMLDGSLFVRSYMRFKYVGRSIGDVC